MLDTDDASPTKHQNDGGPAYTAPRDYPHGTNPARSNGSWWSRQTPRFRKLLIAGLILAVIVIAIAVAVPVAVTQSNSSSDKSNAAVAGDQNGSSSSRASSTVSAKPGVPTGGSGTDWRTASVGGNGSTVYTEDGSSFQYNNSWGGFWNSIPFNDSAQAQADSPPLNQPWDYNNNRISGVNLGGWLTIEPFIVPGLFEPFNEPGVNFNATVIDEYTLSQALGSNLSTVIEEHYKTFITEKDFAQIAEAGLNWIRLPIPFWIVETYPDEPFLGQVGWTYLLKALTWARKYGLRVNLDLHAVPGSQNGYNHSSKQGTVNFLAGVMGLANAQRTLGIIRTLTEFISQDQYKDVVPMFSIMNEPLASAMGTATLQTFYLEVYNMVRGISGIGEGKGPTIVFHDGFVTQQGGITLASNVSAGGWGGFLTGADRIVLDSHPYLCFSTPNNDGLAYQAAKPCSYWATTFNVSRTDFGPTVGGEWSLAVNDCGKWLNNVGNGQRFEGTYYAPGNTTAPMFAGYGEGACNDWNNYPAWNQSWKDGFKLVAEGHQSAFKDWFFWTWKTGFSTALGMYANPLWNYKLAYENGYIPANPRGNPHACDTFVAQQGVTMSQTSAPPYQAWMTGGAGAGTIVATDQVSSWSAWPPASIGNTPVSNLPTYTPTGAIITMSASTPTSYPSGFASVTGPGDGWAQPTDTAGWFVPVEGCSYPNAWSGNGAAIPDAPCTGAARKMRRSKIPAPQPTLPPVPRRP